MIIDHMVRGWLREFEEALVAPMKKLEQDMLLILSGEAAPAATLNQNTGETAYNRLARRWYMIVACELEANMSLDLVREVHGHLADGRNLRRDISIIEYRINSEDHRAAWKRINAQ